MERLGLTPLAQRPIGALSGGQQQRAFVARALVQEPQVLLLDEPFSGIDAVTEDALWTELKALQRVGVLVVVVHHALAATHRFDRVLLLSQRVIGLGPPVEVLTREQAEEAYGPLGGAVLPDAQGRRP